MCVDERVASGQRCDFRDEMTWATRRERNDVPEPVALTELDRPAQHDEHAGRRFARREQALALGVPSKCSEATNARDLAFREPRKHLVLAGGERVSCNVGR